MASTDSLNTPSHHRLKHRVILITGAGGAIGRDIATFLALEHSAKVCVCDLSEHEVQQTASHINNAGGTAFALQVDVSNEDQVKGWVAKCHEKFHRIDGLVNNAAAFIFGTIEEVTSEQWDKILGVNVKGYAFCSKHVAPLLRKNNGGSIVNVGSISSFVAQEAFVPYNTSKGAVMQMTRCMAMDLGVDNIRVNAVCPGVIDTPATSKHAEKLGIPKQELVDASLKQHFIKRMGTTRDVSHAVLFLLSDESSFVTGTSLVVDGGYTAH